MKYKRLVSVIDSRYREKPRKRLALDVGDDFSGILTLNFAHLSRSSDACWDDNEAVKSSVHRLSTHGVWAARDEKEGKEDRRKRKGRKWAEERRARRRAGTNPTPPPRRTHVARGGKSRREPRRVRVAHGNTYTRGISVGEGLPRLGTRKTSFVEYPTGTASAAQQLVQPAQKKINNSLSSSLPPVVPR